MKIFLLIYDWNSKRTTHVEEFEQTQRAQALRAREDAETSAIRDRRDVEVVMLEAASLDVIKRTHGSYFYTVDELAQRLLKAAS